ncbi:MAG: rane dipeptidase [Actinomycetota bacterium]|nr:rane dipeptidase [Actinomycetota bacterium]
MNAAELHRRAVVADTHNDLLMLVCRREPARWAGYFRDRWLPQLVAGGVDVQVLPVFIDNEFRPEGSLRETLRMVEAAHRIAEGNADAVALCRTGAEIDRAVADGLIALVLALEGCPQIDEDVELLETVSRLGVRVVSFAHFGRSALADGSAEDAAGSRLTSAGVEALALLEDLGVMLDVSHLGRSGVDHVLEIASRPVIATHSSSRALRDHHRNLPDEHLKGIAAAGGVVCVNFFGGFVDERSPTLDRLVDHIEHVAAVAGPQAVGLGPDFIKEVFDEKIPLCDRTEQTDGLDRFACVPGLEGPAGLPLVTEALLARGIGEALVRAILGENVMRLFRAELGLPNASAAATAT